MRIRNGRAMCPASPTVINPPVTRIDMSNCTAATDDSNCEVIDKETGEITSRKRKGSLETRMDKGTLRGKIPKIPGKNSQKRIRFASLSTLGAHAMVVANMTGRQYQIAFLLIRDMNYDGKCMTHPDYIASEIGMDSSDVRKALKVLEKNDVLFRMVLKNKGHCYWMNPKFVTGKSSNEVDRLYAIWLIERAKQSSKRSSLVAG